MFLKVIIYIVFAIVTQFVTYKIMKTIDTKERKKLKKWEDDMIDELIEHRNKLETMEDDMIDETIEDDENQ